MPSSSRLLPAPALNQTVRTLARPSPDADPVLRQAAAEAYAQGRADGQRDAAVAALEAATRAGTGMGAAFDAAVAQVRRQAVDVCAETVALALAIAKAVLGYEPHDAGLALGERLDEVLAGLDERPLTISAAPVDRPALSVGLAERPGVSVVDDPSLRPGEARVTGRWTSADLTREALLQTVTEALGLAAEPESAEGGA